jgi:hypothetical protein
LTGTPADWERVRAKAGQLREYDLAWWLDDALLPALDQFLDAAHGRSNLDFWRSLCSMLGASGTQRPVTGWVQCFFPYVIARGEVDSRLYMRENLVAPAGLRRNYCLADFCLSMRSKTK